MLIGGITYSELNDVLVDSMSSGESQSCYTSDKELEQRIPVSNKFQLLISLHITVQLDFDINFQLQKLLCVDEDSESDSDNSDNCVTDLSSLLPYDHFTGTVVY